MIGVSILITPTLSEATGKLDDVPIKNSGWRYNMTIMREQAKTDTFKAKQYKFYLEKNKITDAYVAAYAAAVAPNLDLVTAAPRQQWQRLYWEKPSPRRCSDQEQWLALQYDDHARTGQDRHFQSQTV